MQGLLFKKPFGTFLTEEHMKKLITLPNKKGKNMPKKKKPLSPIFDTKEIVIPEINLDELDKQLKIDMAELDKQLEIDIAEINRICSIENLEQLNND
jgi:hypothetical protein